MNITLDFSKTTMTKPHAARMRYVMSKFEHYKKLMDGITDVPENSEFYNETIEQARAVVFILQNEVRDMAWQFGYSFNPLFLQSEGGTVECYVGTQGDNRTWSEHIASIYVDKRRGKWQVGVNWSPMGTQPTNVTKTVAAMLNDAAELAEQIIEQLKIEQLKEA